MKRLRVAVIEPWMGGSHAAWANGLAAHSEHEVLCLTLPDRAWGWRMRASAPWFADQVQQLSPAPDVIVVSSLCDAAVLRGLIGRSIPLVIYAHESQAAYPRVDPRDSGTEMIARNWTSMIAADQIWFNSHYHKRIALDDAQGFEASMPPEQSVPAAGLAAKSLVVYPGVDLSWVESRGLRPPGPPVILWPHRWESDKNPEVFERALAKLVDAGLDFRLVLAGAEGPLPSEARSRILTKHSSQILGSGPFSTEDYRNWLQRSDLVVSCTGHEFFGMAVVEALAAGCQPVLPDDFSYPELVTRGLHPTAAIAEVGELAGSSEERRVISLYARNSFGTALEEAVRTFGPRPGVDVSSFSWPVRIREYDRLFKSVAVKV